MKTAKSYTIQVKQNGNWIETGYCFLDYDTAVDFMLDMIGKFSTCVYRIHKVY